MDFSSDCHGASGCAHSRVTWAASVMPRVGGSKCSTASGKKTSCSFTLVLHVIAVSQSAKTVNSPCFAVLCFDK